MEIAHLPKSRALSLSPRFSASSSIQFFSSISLFESLAMAAYHYTSSVLRFFLLPTHLFQVPTIAASVVTSQTCRTRNWSIDLEPRECNIQSPSRPSDSLSSVVFLSADGMFLYDVDQLLTGISGADADPRVRGILPRHHVAGYQYISS